MALNIHLEKQSDAISAKQPISLNLNAHHSV